MELKIAELLEAVKYSMKPSEWLLNVKLKCESFISFFTPDFITIDLEKVNH